MLKTTTAGRASCKNDLLQLTQWLKGPEHRSLWASSAVAQPNSIDIV